MPAGIGNFGEEQGSKFIPAKTYEGSRPGYVFTTRAQGTGYYSDGRWAGKREREADDEGGAAKRSRGGGEGSVESILAKADEVEITELDASSLKRLLLSFEKKITLNQQLRVKFFDTPSRFAESEVDLDDAIRDMGLCAAAPELYPKLCELGGVASIVGLVSHENSDISASACSLLYDLTDADVVDSSEAAAGGAAALAAAVEEHEGLSTLAANLRRFDEAEAEEAEAVHNTLGVFKNVVAIGGAALAARAAAGTSVARWLLTRVKKKAFDANKLYASEVLAILASASEDAARAVAEMAGVDGSPDGVDALLTACACYRKRAPAVGDEEECVENLFQALASLITEAPTVAVPLLARAEGVELLVRCVKEGKHAAACALRALAAVFEAPLAYGDADFGFDGDARGAPPSGGTVDPRRRFFEASGLKVLFPALCGRGAARGAIVSEKSSSKSRKAKVKRRKRHLDDQRDLDEHVVSVVASLCLYATPDAPDLAMKRLLNKFLERDSEKVKTLADKYAAYARDVRDAERDSALDAAAGDAAPFARATRVLRAGLHALRLSATALAFAAVHSPTARAALLAKLDDAQTSPFELANALAYYARDVDDAVDKAGDRADDDDDDAKAAVLVDDVARRKAATLRDWAAALSALAPAPEADSTI